MSNKKFNTQEELDEELRRELKAYEELRMIIAIAIETENFASLEPNIAIWENKYHVDEFIDAEIVRKIKAILNKDYLSRLVGDYLASQILREQEKQIAAYNELKSIIDNAKRTKNYSAAEQDIAKWKASLRSRGLSLYGFNRLYTRRIFKLLLLPSKELAIQQDASDSLKKIVNQSKTLDSHKLESEIRNWKSKYSLDTFPDKLEKELNGMTADIFKAITIKKSEEAAISELKSYISSDKMSSPAEEIPVLLSKFDYADFSNTVKAQIGALTTQAISLNELSIESTNIVSEEYVNTHIPPVQQAALLDLQKVFSKSSHNINALFYWIYLNRKISFVPEARDEIKTMFRMAGFAKPTDGTYSIPSMGVKIESLKPKDVSELLEKVVLNYLGILYIDSKSLTTAEQKSIIAIQNKQNILDVEESVAENLDKSDIAMVVPVLDNEASQDQPAKPDLFTKKPDSEPTATSYLDSHSSSIIYEDSEEINILIEDLIQDPAESVDLVPQKDKKTSTTENESTEDLEDNKDITTNEVEPQTAPEEEQGVTLSLLSEEDLKSLEEINYITTTYSIENIPFFKRIIKMREARKLGYSLEKNNGF